MVWLRHDKSASPLEEMNVCQYSGLTHFREVVFGGSLNFLVRLACLLALAPLFGLQAQGRTFVIKNTQDTVRDSSLRGAILAANKLGGNNLIILAKGTYQLTIPGAGEDAGRTGDLDITRGRLTIVGVSAATVTITAASLGDRVFHILPGAQLTLGNVTITGGASADGHNGGGIFNAGKLSLNHCVVRSNYTTTGVGDFVGGSGGHGAGIYNTGWLMLNHCSVSENVTAGGGAGGFGSNDLGSTNRGPGGVGGSGAGICNVGTLELNRCTISRNWTGSGGMGGFSTGVGDTGKAGGKGGNGSGIYNAGKLTVNTTTLNGNLTGAGGLGGGRYYFWVDDLWVFYTGGGSGGSGGDGAGIYNTGDLTLDTSTVSGNTNGAGGSGDGGVGNGGDGGIYSSGALTIKSCTVVGNSGGEGGFAYSIWNESYQGQGGNGGIVNATNGSFATLRNSLVALNLPGAGGIIFVIYNQTNFVGTYGPTPDLAGAFTSLGCNLIGQADGSSGFITGMNGDLVGTRAAPLNPLLGPLQNNGGPSFTHALLPGSPAIDQGKSFGRSADQRGRHRPYDFASVPNAPGGDGTDIGAFELNHSVFDASPDTDLTLVTVDIRPSLGSLAYSTNGQFQFQLTGQVGSNYVIQASTDLTTWIPIATNVIPGSGFIPFADPFATNFSRRFYRATLP
jgi:hypothetical protein